MATPMKFDSIEPCIDSLISTVGSRIVMGIPLGVGKPNPFVNALYRRVKETPALHLKIFTPLTCTTARCHRTSKCMNFLRTGEYLNNGGAQQHYIYSNYTHVARDMLLNGINVLA